MKVISYVKGVGSIMYEMVCSRPDVAHSISLVSTFMTDPELFISSL